MRLFIGWSGSMSHSIAGVLRDKLRDMNQAINPFVSNYDIAKGNLWWKELKEELSTAGFGIVCVTRSNVNSPWLNFEAGALSTGFRVVPFLFHVDPKKLQGGPLEQLQGTAYEKDDVLNLLTEINCALNPADQLKPEQFAAKFESFWPRLDSALQDVFCRFIDETETFYKWLYSVEDLRRTVTGLKGKCIMVVSTSPERDFDLFFVREMIRKNLERSVSYAVLIAKSSSEGKRVIEDAFSSHPDQLCLTTIPDKVFRPLAVTHCVILNYECDAPNLRVFLELPVKGQPYQIEQAYWIEVNEFAARRFAQRFRELQNRYGCDYSAKKSASKQPPQSPHDEQDAAMM